MAVRLPGEFILNVSMFSKFSLSLMNSGWCDASSFLHVLVALSCKRMFKVVVFVCSCICTVLSV